MSVAENTRFGLLLVISGPSGVGKTTIAHSIRDRFDGTFSISATTRPRSEAETDGVDYHFLAPEAFASLVEEGAFLERAQVFGRHDYGTLREPVEDALRDGRLVILDIDVQGARQVRESMPRASMIFIMPPDEVELRRRLEDRGRDDPEAIARRFDEARREVEQAMASGVYDAFVVNDDLETAIEEACSLIKRRLGT